MKNILNILLKWPFHEMAKISATLYCGYLINRYNNLKIRKAFIYLQEKMVDIFENDADYKEMLFYYLKKMMSVGFNDNDQNCKILEIGIGFGNNFKYYPNSKLQFFIV